MNNNKLKEIDIKNCRCQYFHGIINIHDLNSDNILLVEKSYENMLIYDAAYKTLHIAKPLRIIFNKVVRYIRKYNGTKCRESNHSDAKYEIIFDRIRYLII